MPWNFCSACWEGDLEDGEIRAAAAILPSWGYNQWQNGKGAEPKQERETVALGSPAEPLDDSLLSSWVVEFSVTGGGLVAKSCLTLATPWAVAFQARLSIGFSRQEYQSGLPFPSLGDLPSPGIQPASSVLASRFFTTESLGKPCTGCWGHSCVW